MRICSLLPSATEIVCALGLIGDLVGVSHECDYPAAVKALPKVTSSPIHGGERSSAAIDAFVSGHLHEHRSIYSLDEALLERLNPDLILTQELCDVCAVSYEQVQRAARQLRGEHTILSLEPTSLETVLDTIGAVGRASGTEQQADALAREFGQQVKEIGQRALISHTRPRVACVEWLDPPFTGGHWIPEMVYLAGGIDGLGAPGQRSQRVSWDQIIDSRPDVVILMPCGFNVDRTLREFESLALPRAWSTLPAARDAHVYAVDANAYFSRPGPRLVHGIEILAQILGPDAEQAGSIAADWRRVSLG